MGKDLFWKVTPKPIEETTHELSYSTMHYLRKLFNQEEEDNTDYLHGYELTAYHSSLMSDALPNLSKTSTAEIQIREDFLVLIEAIAQVESITLVVKY